MVDVTDRLARHRNREFSLEELVEVVARELSHLAVRPDDGRVTAAPDERAVRFYQTTGLIDRPARYEGRRAVYGYRHLLQLVAVKRLQEEGQPLALIQVALAGRSTSQLEAALGRTSAGSAPSRAGQAPAEPERQLTTVTLIKADLGPGITVTIDPARVDRPRELLSCLFELVTRFKEEGR